MQKAAEIKKSLETERPESCEIGGVGALKHFQFQFVNAQTEPARGGFGLGLGVSVRVWGLGSVIF